MKNVCVVGFGAIGPIHANAIKKTKNATLYAICDIDKSRISKGVEEYDTKGYESFDEVLKDKNIDAVHICTPHHLHFEMIKKALLSGKEVICEKPITRTREEFAALLETDGADKVCVVFQNRLNPCVRKAKEISNSKELGTLLSMKGIVTWNRDDEYYLHDSWRGKYSTEGGGVLINQAVHMLDLMCYFGGKVKDVKAINANFSHSTIEVEDTMCAYLSFEGGANGVFFATNCYGVNTPPEFEMVFEKGILTYSNNTLKKDGEIIETDIKPSEGKVYWGSSHEELISNYYDHNKHLSPLDARNTMETMFSMYDNNKLIKE
ncbi:MAG: Gfo/Idh/MocA family oxidoreductase [Clostridia bacterium]|nr:Gfo/Idh/MocA family oxidoreductase [Clostridia bacterium]